jgi:hypothetical protein
VYNVPVLAAAPAAAALAAAGTVLVTTDRQVAASECSRTK